MFKALLNSKKEKDKKNYNVLSEFLKLLRLIIIIIFFFLGGGLRNIYRPECILNKKKRKCRFQSK